MEGEGAARGGAMGLQPLFSGCCFVTVSVRGFSVTWGRKGNRERKEKERRKEKEKKKKKEKKRKKYEKNFKLENFQKNKR
jgi:hypothetical protein